MTIVCALFPVGPDPLEFVRPPQSILYFHAMRTICPVGHSQYCASPKFLKPLNLNLNLIFTRNDDDFCPLSCRTLVFSRSLYKPITLVISFFL